MNKLFKTVAVSAVAAAMAGEAVAVEWDVALWGKRRAFTEHVEKLAELVSAKTNGEFTLDLNYGGLAAPREMLDGIGAGSFEMAQFCTGYHPEKTPSLTVLELPYLGVNSLELEVEVSNAVYSHPSVTADMARWNATILMPSPLPQFNFAGSGPAPTNLYGLRNISIRAVGGAASAVEVLQSEPVSIAAPNTLEALRNGTVQAAAFAPHAHMAFGIADTATWWTTNLNPGTTNCPIAVNSEALAALEPAHREALLSSTKEAVDHFLQHYNQVTMTAWRRMLDERGIEEVTFNDIALEVLQDASTGSAIAEWIEFSNARDIPAEELLGIVRTTVAEGR
ncbi:MAG: C4-dicarboxylate ABC transporter substrate-binding protein [Pseudomonadota bacterium]